MGAKTRFGFFLKALEAKDVEKTELKAALSLALAWLDDDLAVVLLGLLNLSTEELHELTEALSTT